MNADISTPAIELVVLDLVGTLVADDGQVEHAFERTLAAHGLSLDAALLSRLRGLRKRDAIQQLVSAAPASANAESVYEAFKAALSRAYRDQKPRLVRGAAAFLGWAATQGFKLAVNTGLDRDQADLLLTAVPHRFHAVITGDDVAQSRPAPYLIFRAMEATCVFTVLRVAVAGDTTADLRAGHNAGVRLNVGVLTGAHTREQLSREPHTHLIDTLVDLQTLLAEANLPPA